MKVLFSCTNSDLAGAPIHLFDLISSLPKPSFEILVILGSDGPISEKLKNIGVEVIIIPEIKSSLNIFLDFVALFKFSKIVGKFRPDLIHCHSSKAGLISRLIGFYSSTPVIYTVHGWGFGPGRRKLVSSLVWVSEFLMKPLTSFYIYVSKADEVIGLRYLGICPDKGCVVHNGIRDVECLKVDAKQKTRVLTMVARSAPQKDYDTFFKALQYVDFERCFVIGGGTDKLQFKDRASVNLSSKFHRIEFLGSRSNVNDYLKLTDVFVLSTNFEGLPLSIIEAMRASCPIVATLVGGIPELVFNEVNGFLVAPKNYMEMARKITLILDDQDLKNKFSNQSRNIYLNHFNIDKMIVKITSIYAKQCKT